MQLRHKLSIFALGALAIIACAWLLQSASITSGAELSQARAEHGAAPVFEAAQAEADHSVVPVSPAATTPVVAPIFAPRGEKLQWPGGAPVLSLTLQAQHVRWQI